MEWYLKVVRDNYINFNGRARRKEYWMFTLVHIIIVIVLSILEEIMGLTIFGGEVGIISGLYTLAVFLPALGVTIRRLHDIGKSGWWILIAFVPIIGAIVLIIFNIMDSKPGDNQYGPNPKGIAAVAATAPAAPTEAAQDNSQDHSEESK